MLSLFTILRKNPRRAGLLPGEVALTFDDGPNPEGNVTTDLLNVLHRHSVKAGFCVVGQQVRQSPDIVRRIYRSGHLLINHTDTHQHPWRLTGPELLSEIRVCDRAIGQAIGKSDYRSTCFRSPFGMVTPSIRRIVRHLDLSHILLSHYGWDTRVGPHNNQPVVDRLIENARRHRGGLYVFHDGNLIPQARKEPDWQQSVENRTWIPDAVDRVISELKADGLKFVLPGRTNQKQHTLSLGNQRRQSA